MLVLTRKIGESIIIDDEVDVKVLSVQGGQVSLGIEAPKHIAVHREEIFKKIKGE